MLIPRMTYADALQHSASRWRDRIFEVDGVVDPATDPAWQEVDRAIYEREKRNVNEPFPRLNRPWINIWRKNYWPILASEGELVRVILFGIIGFTASLITLFVQVLILLYIPRGLFLASYVIDIFHIVPLGLTIALVPISTITGAVVAWWRSHARIYAQVTVVNPKRRTGRIYFLPHAFLMHRSTRIGNGEYIVVDKQPACRFDCPTQLSSDAATGLLNTNTTNNNLNKDANSIGETTNACSHPAVPFFVGDIDRSAPAAMASAAQKARQRYLQLEQVKQLGRYCSIIEKTPDSGVGRILPWAGIQLFVIGASIFLLLTDP